MVDPGGSVSVGRGKKLTYNTEFGHADCVFCFETGNFCVNLNRAEGEGSGVRGQGSAGKGNEETTYLLDEALGAPVYAVVGVIIAVGGRVEHDKRRGRVYVLAGVG